MKGEKNSETPSSIFKAGVVSLAFIIIGYESAVFVHRAAVERIESVRDHPDTVYVVDKALAQELLGDCRAAAFSSAPAISTAPAAPADPAAPAGTGGSASTVVIRRNAVHSETVKAVRKSTRRVESFRFDPNTVSSEELQRLGFSEKQAASIVAYRSKGGRFRRKSDFAKSYVVADSVYRRLEPFIDIPRIDINLADSSAFDSLPGIGGYFASKMVSYREQLGGYSYPEQLLDIWHFDREKYDALSDLICCSAPRDSFALWSLPAEELRKHPYIRSWQTARSIELFRENTPKENWSVDALAASSIIDEEIASKLSRCALK